MFVYSAYGLTIRSDLRLPELAPGKGDGSVVIRLEDFAAAPVDIRGKPAYLSIGLTEAVLALDAVGVFLIRQGQEVVVFPAPGVEPGLIRRHLIGNVLAILLYQKGYLVLHASVVTVFERGVAFLGESGAGKSSTAAALHVRGHAILSDDAAVLDRLAGAVRVLPGIPQLKLGQEAADSLKLDTVGLVPMDEWQDKRAYREVDRFATEPAVLGRVYILRRGSDLHIEPLTPHQTVIEFIRHSVPTRFDQPGDVHHFRRCVEFGDLLPAYTLTLPGDVAKLPDVAQLVEEHSLNNHEPRPAPPR